MAEISIVTPHGRPFSILGDLGIICYNLDVRGVLLPQEVVEDSSKDRLQSSGYYIEWDGVVDAELVEVLEVGVDIEGCFHDLKAVVEGDLERVVKLI